MPSNKNVAVLGKGKSLLHAASFIADCQYVIIINNFNKELPEIGEWLAGKTVIHFVNRLPTAVMKKDYYKKYKINKVQCLTKFSLSDPILIRSIIRYVRCGIWPSFAPKYFEKVTSLFPDEYKNKIPNAGLAALYYACRHYRPSKLYVAGIDFYEVDYVSRRSHMSPLENQLAKMRTLEIPDKTLSVLSSFDNISVEFHTYAKVKIKAPNIKVIRY